MYRPRTIEGNIFSKVARIFLETNNTHLILSQWELLVLIGLPCVLKKRTTEHSKNISKIPKFQTKIFRCLFSCGAQMYLRKIWRQLLWRHLPMVNQELPHYYFTALYWRKELSSRILYLWSTSGCSGQTCSLTSYSSLSLSLSISLNLRKR